MDLLADRLHSANVVVLLQKRLRANALFGRIETLDSNGAQQNLPLFGQYMDGQACKLKNFSRECSAKSNLAFPINHLPG